jgi:hypothetical protein
MDERQLITIAEARRRLGLPVGSDKTIYKLVAFQDVESKVELRGLQKRLFIYEDSLEAYIDKIDALK